MAAEALTEDSSTAELIAELGRRLAPSGKVRIELLFVNGSFADGYRHQRMSPRDSEPLEIRAE